MGCHTFASCIEAAPPDIKPADYAVGCCHESIILGMLLTVATTAAWRINVSIMAVVESADCQVKPNRPGGGEGPGCERMNKAISQLNRAALKTESSNLFAH